jgi:uncharacterized protein YjaG (DUF416 family)
MDELDLRAELERLTAWARVSFAALCCERLLPAYAGFAQATGWGDPGVLRQALDRAWAAIASGQAIAGEEARALVERCEQQVPHLDDPFDSDLAGPAQNAAIAVLETVECARDGDPRRAEGVGDLSLDAVEAYVDLTEGQGPIYDAGFVESHVAVRRERDDQDQDLVALGGLDQLGSGVQQRRDHARRSGFTALLQ